MISGCGQSAMFAINSFHAIVEKPSIFQQRLFFCFVVLQYPVKDKFLRCSVSRFFRVQFSTSGGQ